MVELGLANRNATDCGLQKAGSFIDTFAIVEGLDGAEGGNISLIFSKPGGSDTSSFVHIT